MRTTTETEAPLTPKSLNVANAARHIGVSPTTLRRFEAAGIIKSARVGGRILFRIADLDAFIDEAADGTDGAA